MEQRIADFTAYLRNEKKSPENTVLSYSRDLKGFCRFMQEAGVSDAAKVNRTNVMAYVYELQKQKKAGATVSRNIASIRSFYQFLQRKGMVTENPAADIELPKVEKKAPEILSLEKVELLLEQPTGEEDKEVRDKAMLELLYATGIRVTELISLKVSDLNLPLEYIHCGSEAKSRIIPIGAQAKASLHKYMERVREHMISVPEEEALFVNCNQAHDQTGLLEDYQILRKASGHRGGYHTAYSAAFLCGALNRKRCGLALCAGNAGTFRYFNHADLYEANESEAEKRIRKNTSPCVNP